MVDREDVEAFLLRLEVPYRELEDGLWVLGDSEGPPVVIDHTPPLMLLRVEVMEIPEDEELQAGLFRTLLEFNAADLIHGAYGLDGNDIVLTDTLQLQDLDFSEFQASLDSITVALSSHYEPLSIYRRP